MNVDPNESGKARISTIPKPLSNLAWIVILVSLGGISLFPLADFGNRNFAYYLGRIGHYVSFGSPVLLILLVSLLWRGYRKGLPTNKAAWLQLGLLSLLTLSLAVAYGT
jgi:hypothetical protein